MIQRTRAQFKTEQTIPLDAFRIVLQAGTRYRSSSYSTADYLPYMKSKANFVSDASITLSTNDDRMFLSLYMRNIENNRRQLGGNISTANLVVSAVEEPRTYGVRIGGKRCAENSRSSAGSSSSGCNTGAPCATGKICLSGIKPLARFCN